MRTISRLLIFSLFCAPLTLQAEQLQRQHLFKVERNKNANIVQYDAQIGADGKLDRKKPVVVYWVRLAEQGQIKKLSWIQKTFVYGFRTDFDRESDSVSMKMSAEFGQPIKVQRDNGGYQAVVTIDGKPSKLTRVFIHATGEGLSSRLDYIELHGLDLETGGDTYARVLH